VRQVGNRWQEYKERGRGDREEVTGKRKRAEKRQRETETERQTERQRETERETERRRDRNRDRDRDRETQETETGTETETETQGQRQRDTETQETERQREDTPELLLFFSRHRASRISLHGPLISLKSNENSSRNRSSLRLSLICSKSEHSLPLHHHQSLLFC